MSAAPWTVAPADRRLQKAERWAALQGRNRPVATRDRKLAMKLGATAAARRFDTRTRTPTAPSPRTRRSRVARWTTRAHPANCRGGRAKRGDETSGAHSERRRLHPESGPREGTIPTGLHLPLKATPRGGRMGSNPPGGAIGWLDIRVVVAERPSEIFLLPQGFDWNPSIQREAPSVPESHCGRSH